MHATLFGERQMGAPFSYQDMRAGDGHYNKHRHGHGHGHGHENIDMTSASPAGRKHMPV